MFTFETTTTSLLDELFNKTESRVFTTHRSFRTLEDGRLLVSVNMVGHNPDNIELSSNEEKIILKSVLEDDTVPYFVLRHINFEIPVGKEYDGTKLEAESKNGLLNLYIDKKEDKKTKKIKIKV